MPAATSTADPPPPSAAADKPTRSGRLLSLVRRIIDYGRQLASTLRNPSPGTDLELLVLPFGMRDIALILARITRGLQLAGALEARVIRDAPQLDAPPAPAAPVTAPAATPPAQRPRAEPRQPRPVDPRLAQMPTAEQIAARVQRRPIGVVISEICLNLGIARSHPLWYEICNTIVEFGGDLPAFIDRVIRQMMNIVKETRPRLMPVTAPAAASTGPPLAAAA